MEARRGIGERLATCEIEALRERVQELRAAMEKARDIEAREQLAFAASSYSEELRSVEKLHERHERALAAIEAEVALLERARLSILCSGAGDESLRVEQIRSLGEQLQSLSSKPLTLPVPQVRTG